MFTKNVRVIVLENLKEIKEINQQIEEMKSSKNKYSAEYISQQIAELNNRKTRLILDGKSKVEKLAEEYRSAVHAEFMPKGDEITSNAALFSSGIVLSAAQMEELLDRYADNATMTQLIWDNAEKNGVMLNRQRVTEADKASTADVMVGFYNPAMSRPEYSDIWESDSYFGEITNTGATETACN